MSSCVKGKRLAGRDPQLLLDDVDAGDQLGHRVLHLDAGVHLDEVEVAVLVEELEGAGAAVADRGAGGDQARAISSRCFAVMPGAGASSMIFWWRRCSEQSRSPRWTTLPWSSAEDLELDVPRLLQEFLHVDRVVAEGGEGLGLRPR